jgi:phenylalanyl-tRNA synthetase beta chain
MKLPLSLLRQWIDLNEPIASIAETLTLLGIEVDGIPFETAPFSGVVVARVESVEKHPDAARLCIAQVFDGKETRQVVCGAPNCRPGLVVAFAPPGAKLPGMEIQRASIRGVSSEGMLVSSEELGLPKEGEGILELEKAELGQDVGPLLFDPVFELSVTPNLGHALSALGIARELSASFEKPLQSGSFSLKNPARQLEASIQATNGCSRYSLRLIEEAANGPSPFWLRHLLLLSGHRPIHRIVDVTNYIQLKYGQPLHAFDADQVEGPISVKTAETSFSFLCLDGVERTVPKGTLLIVDQKKTLAIAGIIGGEESAVTDATKRVLLESAHFDPLLIRKTASALHLKTESSYRFERGVDPNGLEAALAEAVHLLGGKWAASVDLAPSPIPLRTLTCRLSRVNVLLGTRLSLSELEQLFSRLFFSVKTKNNDELQVTIPSWRFDIQEEIDLVEEAARLFGYNNIERKPPLFRMTSIPHDPQYLFEQETRRRLICLGLHEMLHSDLISPSHVALLGEPRKGSLFKTLHSKSEDHSILRPSLLPSLLYTAKRNADFREFDLAAFEIGRIHFFDQNRAVELPMAALFLMGKKSSPHFNTVAHPFDFYDLKGLVEAFLSTLRLKNEFAPSHHPSFHPGRQADLLIGGLLVGSLGEIHPNLTDKIDLKERVYYAEINLEALRAAKQPPVHFEPLALYPATERDWTLTLPPSFLARDLFQAIEKVRPPYLESYAIIDSFLQKNNLTLRFTYRDPLKTISFEEADRLHTELIEKVLPK